VPQLRFERVHRASGNAAGPMSRLRRFPDNRFIGRRDKMTVYDCDEDGQYKSLAAAASELALDQQNLLQSFAPDTFSEAANRGFRSIPNEE
jgi:hypothetical protein